MVKKFYFKQLSFAEVKVEGFKIFLCITNHLIKHQLFVYTVKCKNSCISSNSI